MTPSTILQTAALCGLLVAGGWWGKDYQLDHKPKAQAKWAYIEFLQCRDSVKEAQLKVCADLQLPPEQCPIDLSQCDKFKEKQK